MALFELITRSELGAYFYRVDLEGQTYEFKYQHNAREDFWYFDILDTAGDSIRSGVKIVSNWPLIARIQDIRRPPGEMIAVEPTEQGIFPTLENLGTKVFLIYQESLAA